MNCVVIEKWYVFTEKFKEYFKRQIINAKQNYQKEFIFIFSWNEWCEGGYLEPDEKNKSAYLEMVYEALSELSELPQN